VRRAEPKLNLESFMKNSQATLALADGRPAQIGISRHLLRQILINAEISPLP
jgi:hypothetical protein